jgi:predicted DNA-binding transcriptional regulator AlpA
MEKFTSFDQLPITLRAEDVAKILGISRANAYVVMHSKGFPKMQIGKRILVTKENFRIWMEKQTSK